MKRRRIAVVTGTRAEYGLLRSVIQAIEVHPRLELLLIAAGMHLLRKFGHTIDQILRDGRPVAARVRMQTGDDSPTDQGLGLARGIAGMTNCFERLQPDVVLVLGDRIEAMAAALAAVATGRILAHIHGGDVAPGDFDGRLRDAITALADVHLAATAASARRLLRLGAEPSRVHVVGAPGLDRLRELLAERRARPASARTRRASRNAPVALILQHAYGRPAPVERRVTAALLRAVADLGCDRIIIYPNSDRGHEGVLQAIDQHCRSAEDGRVRVYRSLPRDDFLNALIDADVLVGNSSAGLIEAPFAGTPSVNVGQRQHGRQAGGPSVVHCPESYAAIRAAVQTALRMRPRRGRAAAYGRQHAGRRIAEILANLDSAPGTRLHRLAALPAVSLRNGR